MFARKVSVRLKPNALSEFTSLMDREILPWLKKQEGFMDLIILAVADNREVATISFWEHKVDAEASNSCGYPDVLKVLAGLLDGTPYVKTFEVVRSTLHQVSSPPPAEPENLACETDLSERNFRPYETSV